ncbi:hypothetical protein VUR80DRAFT_1419 [Thermomyces stellatus]
MSVREERRKMATANIPVIDIGSGRPEAETARELVAAAVEFGFIYVKGGDVKADRAFELSRHLFSTTDVDEKRRCAIQKNNRGWSGIGSETLDPKTQKSGDFKEAFNFGEFVDGKAQQPVPAALAPHEGEISEIFDQCRALAVRILYLLGVGLEVYLTAPSSGLLLVCSLEGEGLLGDDPPIPALPLRGWRAGDGRLRPGRRPFRLRQPDAPLPPQGPSGPPDPQP